jgi:hypothetical protein
VTAAPPATGAPGTGQEPPAGPPPAGRRVPWRTAAIGLTTAGAPAGIGAADPLLGQVAIAVELAIALTVIGTACSAARR